MRHARLVLWTRAMSTTCCSGPTLLLPLCLLGIYFFRCSRDFSLRPRSAPVAFLYGQFLRRGVAADYLLVLDGARTCALGVRFYI